GGTELCPGASLTVTFTVLTNNTAGTISWATEMTREYPETSHFYEIRTQPTVTLDNTAPSVTIDQASGQSDPTNQSPINFTVVFSESVTGFTASDVSLSGTAGATTAVVSGSGTTYNVAVSGMTGDGTVIATIPAGANSPS